MEYLNFELKISAGEEDEYLVSVIRSPEGVGEPTRKLHLPFLTKELLSQMEELNQGGEEQIANEELAPNPSRNFVLPSQQSITDLEHAQGLGRQLFEALLSSEIIESYRESLVLARVSGKGLRLRLRIDAPEIAMLPWEFLYDGKDNFGPLCLSRETLLTRYLEVSGSSTSLQLEPPLNILGMVATPSDQLALNVEGEKKLIEDSVEHLVDRGFVNLSWLEGGTWRDLRKKLRQDEWHVFHFIGHGGFNPETREGLIAFVGEDGKTDHLTASQLADLLVDHRSLRLVVLNACEGSRSSAGNLFSSTATVLMQRGIPSVVAMQFKITDKAALEFSRTFYDTLAEGEPVDICVTEARKSMALALRDTAEWGTPVLHMRSPDGKLFNVDVSSAIFNADSKPPQPNVTTPPAGSAPKKFTALPEMPRGLPILLNKVKQFWIEGVLEKSLFQAAMIDLGVEFMNDAVDNPWGVTIESNGLESYQLQAGQSIADVFKNEGDSLLILGDPGAGKTTTLLNLTKILIQEFEEGERHALPVVFNLSTWNQNDQSIADWMTGELSHKYQVPKKVSQLWLSGNLLMPLFDGLDEIGPDSRETCVQAINAFVLEAGVGIVVCCRTREYIDLPVKLSLNSAVRLQQLKRAQVIEYVARGEKQLEALASILKSDSAMLIDARNPLMLSLMIRAYQGVSFEDLQHESASTTAARRKQLMDAYIARMFRRAALKVAA